MAAPTFTPNARPAGYDQTQRKFILLGNVGLSGSYTIVTGIPMDWTNTVDASGNKIILPPTYTGANGPGQAVPLIADIMSVGGYSLFLDPTTKNIRIWNGTTEVATGALPAALTAAGIPSLFYFLRA